MGRFLYVLEEKCKKLLEGAAAISCWCLMGGKIVTSCSGICVVKSVMSFERSEVTILPGKLFWPLMRPRQCQWTHCWNFTLPQEEEEYYKCPGILHRSLSTIVAEFHPVKCCDSRTHDLAAVTILYRSAWAPTEFSILDFNLAAGAASLPVDLLRKNQLILIAMLLCVSTKKTIQSCKTLNLLFLYAVKWSCPL